MKETIVKFFLFTILITLLIINVYDRDLIKASSNNIKVIDNQNEVNLNKLIENELSLYFKNISSFINQLFNNFTNANRVNNDANNENVLKGLESKLKQFKLELENERIENELKTNVFNLKSRPLRNEIWEQLGLCIFFKRSAGFYIIEKSLFRIFYVTKSTCSNSFDAELFLEHDNVLHLINLKSGGVKVHQDFGSYQLRSLNFNFELLPHLNGKTYDQVVDGKYKMNFYAFFKDNVNQTRTWYPIDVKVKYMRQRKNGTNKTGSIVCSKCFYYENNEYRDFLWWIELNKRIGYQKLVFCNQSIPDTRVFNDIFDKYKEFIHLKPMNTFPDFFNNQENLSLTHHKYLNHYYDLKVNGHFNVFFRDVFDVLFTNECYMEYSDRYEHIAIIDNDETVIPRINKKVFTIKDNFDFVSGLNQTSQDLLEFEALGKSCAKDEHKQIDLYLNSIKTSMTLHFRMSYYLKNRILKDIFDAFETVFYSNSTVSNYTLESTPNNSNTSISNNTNPYLYIINVKDSQGSNNGHTPYDYSFTIQNEKELSYAKSLLFIYRNYLEKYFDNETTKYFKHKDKFNRLFYLGGPITSIYWGKSIYHTEIAFDFAVHFPDEYIIHPVEYDLGQDSHFRENYHFRNINISITELILDLNYFNCFFKPMLKDLIES